MKPNLKIIVALTFLACYSNATSLTALADVKQAAIQVSKSWNEVSQPDAAEPGTVLIGGFPDRQWWQKFQDPHLDTYIHAALQNNPTLNASLQTVAQSRALTAQAFSKELPSVTLSPSAYRIALPDNVKGALPLETPLRLYNLPLQAAYELDLWGKNLDIIRSSRRQAESAELQSHAVLNTVVGDVASAYFNLLRMDALIESQQKNLGLLQRVATLKASQHQAGLLSLDAVLLAQRDAAESEMNLASFRQQQAVFAHQLSILTGSPPASAAQLPRATLEALSLPLETEVGSPGELLTRRPDVLAQEKMLESSRIDVRVARKAFLPSVNLGAMVGAGALGFRNLWDWGNVFNMQSLALSQPIFQGGKLKAELNYRKAKQKEALETYRQVILMAMKDVEDSLSTLKTGYDGLNSSNQQLVLTENSLRLTDSRFQQGLVPKLDVLQAESEQMRYRQSAIRSKADTAIATISLYKALGGGY
ncbi:efflux transporter outer membrane subunit [Vampirovibrio sp.]|uniref:efflux transporter outer membrane subunit n=1 Tax=Vampirovibrio sp. TaxID=2717857 RepID=UPI00359349E9